MRYNVLRQFKQERIEIKEEVLKEIRIEELVTKQDLKAEIEKAKSSIIIWLCGFIVPFLVKTFAFRRKRLQS